MNENENTVIRMLNSVTHVSLRTFDDRLRLQKLVYLIREIGYDCGFTFDWYVRGPYSPTLTRALYFADETDELSRPGVKLSEEENEIVQKLKLLLGKKIEEPETLELLASIWYYLPNFPLTKSEKESLADYLLDKKPNYSRSDFLNGIERILKFKQQVNLE